MSNQESEKKQYAFGDLSVSDMNKTGGYTTIAISADKKGVITADCCVHDAAKHGEDTDPNGATLFFTLTGEAKNKTKNGAIALSGEKESVKMTVYKLDGKKSFMNENSGAQELNIMLDATVFLEVKQSNDGKPFLSANLSFKDSCNEAIKNTLTSKKSNYPIGGIVAFNLSQNQPQDIKSTGALREAAKNKNEVSVYYLAQAGLPIGEDKEGLIKSVGRYVDASIKRLVDAKAAKASSSPAP